MTTLAHKVKPARVVSVSFANRNAHLAVEMDDGRKIHVPVSWFPRLQHGTAKERKNYQLVGGGQGIHWPDLDEDISIEGLLAGHRSHESEKSIQRWLDGRTAKPKPRP